MINVNILYSKLLILSLLFLAICGCYRSDNTILLEPEMVFVKGGSFLMGCEGLDGFDCFTSELPVHKVYVDDFYISKTELTIDKFCMFVNETNYQTDADKGGGSYLFDMSIPNSPRMVLVDGVNWKCDEKGYQRSPTSYSIFPVIHLSYNDVVAYCKWLTEKTGKHYRLPTEAEWEFASRGGTKSRGTKFSGSNNLKEVGWSLLDKTRVVSAVARKKSNELGLFDMSGNLWEYCSDYRTIYDVNDSINPQGAKQGDVRVVKGGCVISIQGRCTVWSKGSTYQDYRRDRHGVRIVCDAD